MCWWVFLKCIQFRVRIVRGYSAEEKETIVVIAQNNVNGHISPLEYCGGDGVVYFSENTCRVGKFVVDECGKLKQIADIHHIMETSIMLNEKYWQQQTNSFIISGRPNWIYLKRRKVMMTTEKRKSNHNTLQSIETRLRNSFGWWRRLFEYLYQGMHSDDSSGGKVKLDW